MTRLFPSGFTKQQLNLTVAVSILPEQQLAGTERGLSPGRSRASASALPGNRGVLRALVVASIGAEVN